MSVLTRTDVTAVKLIGDLVFSGIGSYINIFDKAYGKFNQRIRGLNGQKVYGFVPFGEQDKILVFGGKQFTVVSASTCGGNLFERIFDPIVCDDWIHNGIWIDEETIAVLTAHNVVQKWNISTQSHLSEDRSSNNSILYSGLLLPLDDEVLVFAGTVFSEVLVHVSSDDAPLHCLKGHRGVIFSISCKPENNIIATTSDDRSVRIWNMVSSTNDSKCSKEYWKNINIECVNEIYGHSARVMRSCITNALAVSVGEDSNICFWDHKGNLLRKVATHQNGCIWAVDADKDALVTGGGDCGVILHPLSMALEYGEQQIIKANVAPKKIMFTARKNIVILSENDEIVYYDTSLKSTTNVYKLNHNSTYKQISLSSCKQIVAVADMNGNLNVFIENCKDEPTLKMIVDTKIDIGKILSMHWAGNRHLVFCSDKGIISVVAAKASDVETVSKHTLPHCKERWLTAVALESSTNSLVVGDRCGNVHVYVQGNDNPVKSFNKVHGRYGPTTIAFVNNSILSTGRDGTIKTFFMTKEDNILTSVKYLSAQNLEFAWLEKFLDRKKNIICGFQERIFVVYNVKHNNKLLEVECGGGHRSWDATRYFDKIRNNCEEFIDFIYIKNSDIHYTSFQMNKIVSRNIINGNHCKEINCLKRMECDQNRKCTYFISGGEDTTLRLTEIDSELNTSSNILFRHLSSIRALKVCLLKDSALVISAGGRAQIGINKLHFNKLNEDVAVSSEQLVNYLIKGKDKERNNNQDWRNYSIDFDPETRIMDVEVYETNDSEYYIFVSCSDTLLRIYKFTDKDNEKLIPISEIKYHKTCILKCHIVKFNDINFLFTCTTRGVVAVWDINNIIATENDTEPMYVTNFNISGINSITSRVLSDTSMLIATGGDDNSIHIKLLNVITMQEHNNSTKIEVLDSWSSDKYHCSQVTGVHYVDDIIISTSIDQRVTLLKWKVIEDRIECEFISQTFSDVADIQGMEIVSNDSESIRVCIYGKGMEIIEVRKQ